MADVYQVGEPLAFGGETILRAGPSGAAEARPRL